MSTVLKRRLGVGISVAGALLAIGGGTIDDRSPLYYFLPTWWLLPVVGSIAVTVGAGLSFSGRLGVPRRWKSIVSSLLSLAVLFFSVSLLNDAYCIVPGFAVGIEDGAYFVVTCTEPFGFVSREKLHYQFPIVPQFQRGGATWRIMVPTWIPLLLLAGLFAAIIVRAQKIDYPSCPKCHYNLTGIGSARCPECGNRIDDQAGCHVDTSGSR